MRAIMIMFDTLSKDYLPNYGNDWVHAPNFERLKQQCCRFDNFYGGSMPCMPARRELHTGRYNFLHRSWGPLEPFDCSVLELMKQNGVYTHLCTDHSHYFEDGGATYHNRYCTWEGFRGQEGDRWMPQILGNPNMKRNPLSKKGISVQQNYANRTQQAQEHTMSGPQTFEAGLAFLKNYKEQDNWFLQIECFDPHEPFDVPQTYRDLYELHDEVDFDWPAYGPIDVDLHKEELHSVRKEYAALITMCDSYLGKVLDVMDEQKMWDDTMLIVNTDHGLLLGEHGFMGKNFPPLYDEVIHIPFFLHVPNIACGERKALCQSIDIAPTLLDYFEIDAPCAMDGCSLLSVLNHDYDLHEAILYGVHGGHTCILDKSYTYMCANINEDNTPFVECTLLPTKMRGFHSFEELQQASLVAGDAFSNNYPYLKFSSTTYMNAYPFGNLLYDIQKDPKQCSALHDEQIESIYRKKLQKALKQVHAPSEEFQRLGL